MTAESLKKLCSSPNGNRTNREIWRRQTVAAPPHWQPEEKNRILWVCPNVSISNKDATFYCYGTGVEAWVWLTQKKPQNTGTVPIVCWVSTENRSAPTKFWTFSRYWERRCVTQSNKQRLPTHTIALIEGNENVTPKLYTMILQYVNLKLSLAKGAFWRNFKQDPNLWPRYLFRRSRIDSSFSRFDYYKHYNKRN